MIGQALTGALSRDGHEVWALSRDPQAARLPPGVQAAGWDGRTPQGWQALAGQVDAIVNLAGANIGARPWTNARKHLIRSSRTEAGAAIVAALEQSARKPAVVVQIAGVGYYGPGGDEIYTESSPPGNDFMAGIAQDWENSTRPVANLGVRHAIMRTGVVLTRKGGMIDPFLLQHRLFAGGPIGSGRQWISWIHVQDLVNAIRFFLEREDAAGVFNVTSPEPVTNATFGRTMGQVLRRPYWLPVPGFVLNLVMGEMSALVLTGQRVLPERLQRMGFRFQFAGLREALEDLAKKG
jgi:uncharacterized protein (TIGR01777 family)